ncbi:unnamed protein product, partial [Choristocarpus tenellus]
VTPLRCLSRKPDRQGETRTISLQQDFHTRIGIKPIFTFIQRSCQPYTGSPCTDASTCSDPEAFARCLCSLKYRTSFRSQQAQYLVRSPRSISHIRSPACALIPTCFSHRQGER